MEELREKESDMRGHGDIVVPGVCVRMGGVSCMGESSGQPYPATTKRNRKYSILNFTIIKIGVSYKTILLISGLKYFKVKVPVLCEC